MQNSYHLCRKLPASGLSSLNQCPFLKQADRFLFIRLLRILIFEFSIYIDNYKEKKKENTYLNVKQRV